MIHIKDLLHAVPCRLRQGVHCRIRHDIPGDLEIHDVINLQWLGLARLYAHRALGQTSAGMRGLDSVGKLLSAICQPLCFHDCFGFLGLRGLLGEERRAEGEETEKENAAHGA